MASIRAQTTDMLLAIDIGNSHSVLGAWQANQLVASCRVASDVTATSDQWRWLLSDWLQRKSLSNKKDQPLHVVYASVSPAIENALSAALRQDFSLVVKLKSSARLPFVFDYQGVNTLGADRIADSIAAVSFYGDSCLVIDFGTAITFNLITEKVYRGGVILPGITTAANALTRNTAQLPHVDFYVQKEILGKTTVDSIEKGIYFAYRAMVKELVEQFRREAQKYTSQKIMVIATGGISHSSAFLGFAHEFFDVTDANLTLRGLYQYYLLNYENETL